MAILQARRSWTSVLSFLSLCPCLQSGCNKKLLKHLPGCSCWFELDIEALGGGKWEGSPPLSLFLVILSFVLSSPNASCLLTVVKSTQHNRRKLFLKLEILYTDRFLVVEWGFYRWYSQWFPYCEFLGITNGTKLRESKTLARVCLLTPFLTEQVFLFLINITR